MGGDGAGGGGAGAGAGARRTSETLMSSRMFRMRFARGCRRCPRSFPKGAVYSVARQLGHLGFSYLRSAFRSISCAQSRWKQCPHAWSIRTTSAPGPGSGSGSMQSVHMSGPSTRERVPQHAMVAAPSAARNSLSGGGSEQPYLLPSTVPTASRLLRGDAFSRASGERGAWVSRPRESSTDVASRPRWRPVDAPAGGGARADEKGTTFSGARG